MWLSLRKILQEKRPHFKHYGRLKLISTLTFWSVRTDPSSGTRSRSGCQSEQTYQVTHTHILDVSQSRPINWRTHILDVSQNRPIKWRTLTFWMSVRADLSSDVHSRSGCHSEQTHQVAHTHVLDISQYRPIKWFAAEERPNVWVQPFQEALRWTIEHKVWLGGWDKAGRPLLGHTEVSSCQGWRGKGRLTQAHTPLLSLAFWAWKLFKNECSAKQSSNGARLHKAHKACSE